MLARLAVVELNDSRSEPPNHEPDEVGGSFARAAAAEPGVGWAIQLSKSSRVFCFLEQLCFTL